MVVRRRGNATAYRKPRPAWYSFASRSVVAAIPFVIGATRAPALCDGIRPNNRHTVASRALVAGESVDEIAFLLGHRDANVTRAVYVREVADARRRSMRRSRMVAEFGGALRVALAACDEAD